MDVDTLCSNLGITNKKVISKSKELMRLSKVKCPHGLGASEICKPIACISISCRLLEIELDKEKAVKISGASERLFNLAVSSIHNILGIKKPLSIDEIATEFKHPDLISQSVNLLKIYKEKFLGGISEVQSKYVDFENAEFSASVFYVMACQNSIEIDKNKLVSFSKCNLVEFQRAVNSITDVCYNDQKIPLIPKQLKLSLSTPSKPITSPKSKTTTTTSYTEAKRSREELDRVDENQINHGELSMDDERKIIKKKKENSYKEWASSVIDFNAINNEKLKTINQSIKRQTTIDTFFKPLSSNNFDADSSSENKNQQEIDKENDKDKYPSPNINVDDNQESVENKKDSTTQENKNDVTQIT